METFSNSTSDERTKEVQQALGLTPPSSPLSSIFSPPGKLLKPNKGNEDLSSLLGTRPAKGTTSSIPKSALSLGTGLAAGLGVDALGLAAAGTFPLAAPFILRLTPSVSGGVSDLATQLTDLATGNRENFSTGEILASGLTANLFPVPNEASALSKGIRRFGQGATFGGLTTFGNSVIDKGELPTLPEVVFNTLNGGALNTVLGIGADKLVNRFFSSRPTKPPTPEPVSQPPPNNSALSVIGANNRPSPSLTDNILAEQPVNKPNLRPSLLQKTLPDIPKAGQELRPLNVKPGQSIKVTEDVEIPPDMVLSASVDDNALKSASKTPPVDSEVTPKVALVVRQRADIVDRVLSDVEEQDDIILTSVRSTSNVLNELYPTDKGRLAAKLVNASDKFREINRVTRPLLDEVKASLEGLKGDRLAEVDRQVRAALTDRANADQHLTDPAAEPVFKATETYLDAFKQILSDAGVPVRENFFTDVKEVAADPAKLAIRVDKRIKKEQVSPFLQPKEGQGEGTPGIGKILSRYQSSVPKALVIPDVLTHYNEVFIPEQLALGGFSTPIKRTFHKSVIEDFLSISPPDDKAESFLSKGLSNIAKSLINFSPRFALKNPTQKIYTFLNVRKGAIKMVPVVKRLETQFPDLKAAVESKPAGLFNAGGPLPEIENKTIRSTAQLTEEGNFRFSRRAGFSQSIMGSRLYRRALKATGSKVKAFELAAKDPATRQTAIEAGIAQGIQDQLGNNAQEIPKVFKDLRRNVFGRAVSLFTSFNVRSTENIINAFTTKGTALNILRRGGGDPRSSIAAKFLIAKDLLAQAKRARAAKVPEADIAVDQLKKEVKFYGDIIKLAEGDRSPAFKAFALASLIGVQTGIDVLLANLAVKRDKAFGLESSRFNKNLASLEPSSITSSVLRNTPPFAALSTFTEGFNAPTVPSLTNRGNLSSSKQLLNQGVNLLINLNPGLGQLNSATLGTLPKLLLKFPNEAFRERSKRNAAEKRKRNRERKKLEEINKAFGVGN